MENLNTAQLDRAAAALAQFTDKDKIEYLTGIAQRWDNQAAVDYMAKALLGT